jgi:hypothetical protein
VTVVAAIGSALPISAQRKLPPLSYICTMPGDEDVLEDKPGRCPKCGMELEGIRLDSVWTCPIHAAIIKEQPGKCPIDARELIPMTMALSFVCPGTPKESINPGTCPDGSPMQRKYSPRPHGNHNPQHGGAFFMAPDNWHHLEGAYFAPGTFRLYLYDDFTRPLPAAQVRATTARLILPNEGKEIPLVRNGQFLQASIGKLPFPVVMQAKVKFQPDAPEHHFDFTFEKFSKDLPVVATPTVTTTPAPSASASPAPAAPGSSPPAAPAAAPAPPASAPAPPAGETVPSPVDSALALMPIPETVPEMLAQLRTRNDQIRMFIDRGAYASVYVPAFQAKDVALALDAKKGSLPADKQRLVSPAVNRLIRTAYLLDAFGDLGNKQQIVDAYSQFAGAVQDLESAFPKQP